MGSYMWGYKSPNMGSSLQVGCMLQIQVTKVPLKLPARRALRSVLTTTLVSSPGALYRLDVDPSQPSISPCLGFIVFPKAP